MNRKMTVVSCVLWIAGIAATIIGLNVEGNTGTWMTVCGNIAFLLGLALQGVLWLQSRKQQAAPPAAQTPPEEPKVPDTPDAQESEETKNG